MSAILKVFLIFSVVATLAQQSLATDVTLCFESAIEQRKCEKMAEHVTDVTLKCVTESPCSKLINDNKADAMIVDADDHTTHYNTMEPVLFESFADDNVIIAVINSDQVDKVDTLPLDFDEDDLREYHSALYLNHLRKERVCKKVKPASGVDTIKFMRYHVLPDKTDKKLVCVENEKIVVKSVDDFKKCHVEANIPGAVMMKKNSDKKDTVVNMLMKLTELVKDDFKLFGVFEDKHNVMFSDEAKGFTEKHQAPNGITVDEFVKLHCGDVSSHH